jgi:hypothetical protein
MASPDPVRDCEKRCKSPAQLLFNYVESVLAFTAAIGPPHRSSQKRTRS